MSLIFWIGERGWERKIRKTFATDEESTKFNQDECMLRRK